VAFADLTAESILFLTDDTPDAVVQPAHTEYRQYQKEVDGATPSKMKGEQAEYERKDPHRSLDSDRDGVGRRQRYANSVTTGHPQQRTVHLV